MFGFLKRKLVPQVPAITIDDLGVRCVPGNGKIEQVAWKDLVEVHRHD